MLRDNDGDGQSDMTQTVADRPGMHGIVIGGDTPYLITVENVYRTTRRSNGTLGELERIIEGLRAGGQHPNRMVMIGPDGMLYVSVGSTCNACGDTDPRNAAMMRFMADGTQGSMFASGLRNTIGYGFAPRTDVLWGMEHGIDRLGDNEQHEELNRIIEGAKYGWHYVHGEGRFDPQDYPENGLAIEERAAQSTNPKGLYVPHSAPMQMAFYTGEALPEDYQGDAFVAMRRYRKRAEPSGYEVIRIGFANGQPVGIEAFVIGFLMEDAESTSDWGRMGRLVGLAQGPDGALYLPDDTGSAPAEGEDEAALDPTNQSGRRSASCRRSSPPPRPSPARRHSPADRSRPRAANSTCSRSLSPEARPSRRFMTTRERTSRHRSTGPIALRERSPPSRSSRSRTWVRSHPSFTGSPTTSPPK